MAPQVSLVSDDGIALPLSLLTFTKPDTENGPELRRKSERSVVCAAPSLFTAHFCLCSESQVNLIASESMFSFS